MRPAFLFSLSALTLVRHGVFAQTLSADVLNTVRGRMNQSSTASWEMGTAAQALLELDYSSYSVFASSPPFSPDSSLSASTIDSVLYFARNALRQRNGTDMIMNDGAAGDPASLGVAVILGNLTGADTGVTDLTFETAASQEINYLLNEAPRNSDGAISHRANQVQLWSDFVYMVPPFLAYYGVTTGNQSLISEAVNQISLYRTHLKESNSGFWKHIVLGTGASDNNHWSTGNAWVAAGIIRVLATIQNSSFSKSFKKEKLHLTTWANEIHDAFYNYQDPSTNLNHNWVDQNSSFIDASGSALMASTVYRLSLLSNVHKHLPAAERARNSIGSSHIDSDGWLNPVVNPLSFTTEGKNSPEGQAFILLMEAAYRDWTSDGSKGANAAVGMNGRVTGGLVLGSFVFGVAAVVALGMV